MPYRNEVLLKYSLLSNATDSGSYEDINMYCKTSDA